MNDTSLSYARGGTEPPLLEEPIGDLLDRIAALFPDNEALVSVHQKQRFTYRAFVEEVDRCARALPAAGSGAGPASDVRRRPSRSDTVAGGVPVRAHRLVHDGEHTGGAR